MLLSNVNIKKDDIEKFKESEKTNDNISDVDKISEEEINELINIYEGIITFGESYKSLIAYNYVSKNKFFIVENCDEYGGQNVGCYNGSTKGLKYNDLNESYKYLFGNNSLLSRGENNIFADARNGRVRMNSLKYSGQSDSFVMTALPASLIVPPSVYEIVDSKIESEKITISVLYSITKSSGVVGFFLHTQTNYISLEKKKIT